MRPSENDPGCIQTGRLIGLLYLAPALAFVLAFTAYPFVQMLWMSLHNWSLIEPPRSGSASPTILKAWKDRQFWTSLGFTLNYTLYITPILMVGGFLIALLVAENTPAPPLHARRRLRAGRHRPRGVEPALVLAVQLRLRPGQPRAPRPRHRRQAGASGSAKTPTSRSGR